MQCTATAKSTGLQCKTPALKGSDHCVHHSKQIKIPGDGAISPKPLIDKRKQRPKNVVGRFFDVLASRISAGLKFPFVKLIEVAEEKGPVGLIIRIFFFLALTIFVMVNLYNAIFHPFTGVWFFGLETDP